MKSLFAFFLGVGGGIRTDIPPRYALDFSYRLNQKMAITQLTDYQEPNQMKAVPPSTSMIKMFEKRAVCYHLFRKRSIFLEKYVRFLVYYFLFRQCIKNCIF